MTRLPPIVARPLIFVPGIVAAVAIAAITGLVLMPAPHAVAAVVAPPALQVPAPASTSIRAASAAPRARWVDGHRVILIGGATARALEEQRNVPL